MNMIRRKGLTDIVQIPGIFERKPFVPDGVPDYAPKPWEIGRSGIGSRQQPYLRIEIPEEIPNPEESIEQGKQRGIVNITFDVASVQSRYIASSYKIYCKFI